MTDTNARPLSWTPTPAASRGFLIAFAVGGALIGVVGFSLSFWSVALAAAPYLGWASWALPVLTDVAIFTLSGLSIFLELSGIKAKWIRLIPDALVAYTVYLNTATQPSWFGKAVHAAGPLLWVTVVEIAGFTVRRLVGLTAPNRMDRVRTSRWLLAPASTFRLWRRMRLWEITSYSTAVDREQQLSASRALLREWHGRKWRTRAPRAERLAVKLQGTSERPVAELLTEAADSITAAARAAVRPLSDEQRAEILGPPEVHLEPEPKADSFLEKERGEQDLPKPRPKRTASRGRRGGAKRTPGRRTDEQLIAAASALEVLGGEVLPVRRLMTELGIGQDRAKRVREHLDQAALAAVSESAVVPVQPALVVVPVSVPEVADVRPIEYANGTAPESYESIVSRL
jgi:Protein of unknown function (DUF2637)